MLHIRLIRMCILLLLLGCSTDMLDLVGLQSCSGILFLFWSVLFYPVWKWGIQMCWITYCWTTLPLNSGSFSSCILGFFCLVYIMFTVVISSWQMDFNHYIIVLWFLIKLSSSLFGLVLIKLTLLSFVTDFMNVFSHTFNLFVSLNIKGITSKHTVESWYAKCSLAGKSMNFQVSKECFIYLYRNRRKGPAHTESGNYPWENELVQEHQDFITCFLSGCCQHTLLFAVSILPQNLKENNSPLFESEMNKRDLGGREWNT